MLHLRKDANQDKLDQFFVFSCDQPLADSVSKSVLTDCRAKRRAETFAELNVMSVDEAMRILPLRRWQGFRVLTVDESPFLLPKEPAIVARLGQTGELTPTGVTRVCT